MRRNIYNIIHYEDIFNPSPNCIYGSSFKWLSAGDNELVCGQPLKLVTPGNIFLKTCYNIKSYPCKLYIQTYLKICLSYNA